MITFAIHFQDTDTMSKAIEQDAGESFTSRNLTPPVKGRLVVVVTLPRS
jgi:hypothetical protein